MKNLILFLLAFTISFVFMQCNDQIVQQDGDSIRELSTQEKKVSGSSEDFGLKLFRKTNELEKDKNIFIAPLSVSYALGMTLNGAKNETYNSMLSTLELNGLSLDEINKSFKSLMQLLTTIDPKVAFQIANSIWYRDDLTVKDEFVTVNKNYFDALVSRLNFSDPLAAGIINNWVSENTNGKIKEIVDNPIDPYTVMFLINAIYFKGSWKYQFDPNYTKDDQFFVSSGVPITCKMMSVKSKYKFASNSEGKMIELPYGEGNYCMDIVLPKLETDINSFIENLSSVKWNEWLGSLSEQEVNFFLPKFNLEYKLKMNDVLAGLGMSVAFTPAADFTGMHSPSELYIGQIRHKTFVEVNEEGTEAAGVTVVEMIRTTETGNNEIFMQVNHPFVLVIRERNTNAILFIGKIINPS